MSSGEKYLEESEEFSKNYDLSDTVILSVPYDKTSTYGKGADKGPKAIIDAYPNLEFYDAETKEEFYPNKIFIDKPILENSSPDKMVEEVKKRVESHLSKNKFVVLIGGEHSVSVGTIYAHAKKFKNMSILQFDAHADLREDYHGSKYNHACIMRRAQEVSKTVQVGIRSVAANEKNNLQKVFFAHDIAGKSGWQKKVADSLSKNVYVTIDLDVFDSSIMPSTGTPEPGGLNWYEVVNTLKEVAKTKNIVGFDIVELCPKKENSAPDFLAAKLLFKLLIYKKLYAKK